MKLWLSVVLLWTFTALAAPREFSYPLQDGKTLKFTLDDASLERYRHRIRYRPELAQLYVRNGMVRYTASLMQSGVSIRLSPPNVPLAIDIRTTDNAKLVQLRQQINQEQQRLFNDYLTKHSYRLQQDHRTKQWIVQDHRQHFQQAQQDLLPVAEAIVALYGSNNIRQVATAVTSWVEQIPYQNLEDRQSSPGVGYLPPIELLFKHQGDCDSKAVLCVSVMRLIFPKLPMALVYFDDHAMVAARIPARDKEQTISVDGMSLMLIDATGPAQAPIGQPNPDYLDEIANQQFTLLDL